MATSSYSNLFGTNGAGQQGSQAGISTMFGQQATGESEEEKRRKAQQAQQQQGGQAPQQTFAQMQQAGQARPAPPPAGGAQPAQAPQQPSQTVQQLQQRFQQMPGGAQAQQAAPAPAQAPAQPRPQAAPQMAPGAQPQGYEGMLSQLQQQLTQALQQPSGYTSPEFQQLREAQMGQLQQEFGAQRQALEEDLARRGLSASSIGAGRMGDLAGQQSQAMANLQAQLLQQQAEMTQRGKETTLKTFADVTGQVGTRGLGEQEIGLKEKELLDRQNQFGEQMRFNRDELALRGELGRDEQALAERRLEQEGRLEEARQAIQEKELGQRNEQFYSSLGAEESRFARTIDEQRQGRLQQLGLSTRELDLQAQKIQDDARLRGDEISLTRARDEAEIVYRGERLQQELKMQGIQISAEEARQEAQLDFERERTAQQEDQFTRSLDAESQRFLSTLEEQRANRLQQLGISTQELDLRAKQIQNEYERSGQTIDLQKARDEAEVDYRADQLAQQLEMQGRQFDFDELRQQAQLDFQREQGELDAALRREGYTVDRERINQAREQFNAGMELDRARLEQAESQFGRSFGFQERQADEDLIMRLGDIFSRSDDPKAAEQIGPLMQQLMSRLRGQGGGQQGGRGGGQTQTATATGPIGTVGPTGETTTAPKTPMYTPPAYTPPANNPYNNPLGPTSDPEPVVQQMPNFDEILRFGEESYNPYDTYGYDPYAYSGGAY